MKTRILSAAVGIPLLLAVFLLLPEWCLGILIGGISGICAWELLHCLDPEQPPRISAYAAVCAFCICFLQSFYGLELFLVPALFALFALCFAELMLSFRKEPRIPFSVVANALFAGVVLPLLFSGFVRLGRMECGRYCALLPLVVSFSSDAGAYFVGVTLGKHKLTPHISPNKTLEGSVGGFVCAIALTLVYGLILKALGCTVNLPVLGVCGFLGSLASQLGDLSFSAVKRLAGVKDYGRLIPGHGGMMDRCDSLIWAAALLALLLRWVPVITT